VTALPGSPILPVESRSEDAGPRFRYPSEIELSDFSASQRRMIYEYFDLLNGRVSRGEAVP
jgi:hypothetical protein